jgi:hypothetical protein
LVIITLISIPVFLTLASSIDANASQGNSLSNHWLPQQGCFRDELNQSDIDYYNCWTDNTGKILTTAEITGDTADANNALFSLERYGLSTTNDYLPETIVNSTSILNMNGVITNRIASLDASNQSSSNLEQLAFGNYYAGEQILGYLGSDRLLINGTIYRSSSSAVFQTNDGFVKRSLFSISGSEFYLYLNASLNVGNPYVNVSLQVLPLNASTSSSDLLYLQVFSSQGQFDNASLYNGGNYERALVYNGGSPSAQNGTIIAYSTQQSVFMQDSVAINFSGSASSPVDDFEHWYRDGAFNSMSWIGIAYNAPQDSSGRLSSPILTRVYPIEHLDYHLVNETAKYIAQNVKNTTVSPPVSFGFVAYGLALASAAQSNNESLATLARNYWNFYYAQYNSSNYYTPYARSINVFALAGFKLYGCNSTVEQFTRNFLSNTSGASIEEDGWGTAALYQLQSCTGSSEDLALYDSFVNSFFTNNDHFTGVLPIGAASPTVVPSFTFQYAEAASGLILGHVPFNNPVVLSLMNAVYQSNVSDTVLNQPYHGDLANTETLPAYSLSTWLFQGEMKNETGYWISSLQGCNLTSILYSNNSLIIGANGGPSGSITLSSRNGSDTYPMNKSDSVILAEVPTTTVVLTNETTVTSTTTSTFTETVTLTVTSTTSSISTPTIGGIFAVGVVLGLAASSAYFVRRRKK